MKTKSYSLGYAPKTGKYKKAPPMTVFATPFKLKTCKSFLVFLIRQRIIDTLSFGTTCLVQMERFPMNWVMSVSQTIAVDLVPNHGQ